MAVETAHRQTAIGVIPDDWEVKRLSELCDIKGRVGWKGYTKKDLRRAGPLAIGAKHIDNQNRLDLSDPTHLSVEKFTESPEIVVEQNDILIVQRGTLGRVVLIDRPIGDATINPSMVIARVRRASPTYLYYQLSSAAGQRQILVDTSTTGVPMISQKQIGGFEFPLPPSVREQDRIATALSDVDALLGALDRLIAKKRDLKQAAMQQVLTGQSRLPGFTGKWETLQAGDVGRFRGGAGFPTSAQGNNSGVYPLFKVSDMNHAGNESVMVRSNNWISEDVRRQLGATAFPAGSIVFAKVGAAVFLERKRLLVRASCLDNNMAAFVVDGERLDPHFALLALRNTRLSDFVSTTALPSLNSAVLAKIPLRVPPLPEQAAIVLVFADIDAELTALEHRRDKSRLLKQGMMQELLTGRTRLV